MKKILTSLLIFISSVIYCGEVNWSDRVEGSSIASTSSINIVDADYSLLNTSNTLTDESAFGYIRFGVGENEIASYSSANVDLTLNFTVDTYDNNGNLNGSFAESLAITYSIDGFSPTIDMDEYRMNGVHKFEVKNITISAISAGNTVAVPEQIYLECGFTAERYYNLETQTPPSIGLNTINFDPLTGVETIFYNQSQTTAETDEFEIYWDYVPGAEEYELEWTWVDNYSKDGVGDALLASGVDLSELDFKRNSSRIRTGNQSYRIPHVFGRGFLVYRVRGIGRWLDDTDKNKYGEWTSSPSSPTAKVSDWTGLFEILTEHQGNLNWQYQSTYAENGKKKEVVQYFDGSLRGRQTVTRINSDYQSVVGEVVYDNQGRDAVNILPAPVNNPAVRFYDNLNQNTAQLPFSHLDFDWEDTLTTDCSTEDAAQLDDGSGASKYYSDNHTEDNWQQYVPDAEGYAYVQKQYTPDNTGRVRKQSGAGEAHKMGGGKETAYFYLQPSQEELNRLFGYKVGYKKRYKKNMVVDANGQVSVSYLDAQGRVVATSMAGDNATDFEALDSEQDQTQHASMSTDLLGKDDVIDPDTDADDNDLYASGNFDDLNDGLNMGTQLGVIQDNSNYDFDYTVTTSYYEDSCNPGIGYPYVYDLGISLKDDCGFDYLEVNETVGNMQIGQSSGSVLNLPIPETLNQGSYTLSKDIRVDQEAYEFYLEDYLENNACIQDIDDFISPVDTSCYVSCDECAEALGTEAEYLANRQNELGTVLTLDESTMLINQYNTLLADCMEPCEIKSNCDALYGMLLVDVSLQGQYGAMSSSDPLSVYNTSNSLPSVVSTDHHWKNPYTTYLDEFGNPALVDNGQGTMVPPEQLATVQEFFAAYQPSWAASLVPYHPEYKLYQFRKEICEMTQDVQGHELSSDEYDQLIQTDIDSYLKATGTNNWTISFLSSSASLLFSEDPYFDASTSYPRHEISGQNSYGTSFSANYNVIKNTMMDEAIYSNYDGTGMSMFDFSVATALCGTNFSGTCASGVNTWADVANNLSPQEQDAIWQQYKSNYLGQKLKIQQLIQDFYAFQNHINIYNGCLDGGGYSYPYLLSFDWYTGFPTLLLQYFALEEFFPVMNLSLNLCGGNYTSKTVRIPRVDDLIGGTGNNLTDLQNASEEADYATWQQTGLCPLMIDMEGFIKELAIKDALNDFSTNDTVPQFTNDLFTVMSGVTPPTIPPAAVGSVTFDGTVTSATSLELVVSDDITEYCKITFGAINGLSWSDYNTASGWHIYDVSGSYPSSTDPNGAEILITAGPDASNTEQYLVTYTNDCIQLNDCQTEYSTSNGSLNENDPDCDKKENVYGEIIAIMNEKIADGDFFNSSVSLQGNPLYVASELGPIINDANYDASWSGSQTSITFVDPVLQTNPLLAIYPTSGNFPTNIIQVISLDVNGLNFTMEILSNTSSPVVTTIEGNIIVFGFGGDDQLDFSCPCEEAEYSEGEDLAAFFNHLLSLEDVPHGYLPPVEEFDLSAIWTDPYPDLNDEINPGVTAYSETETGISMYTDYYEDSPNVGSKCPLYFDFVDVVPYTGADISHVMNIYFVGNSGGFYGTAMMNDGASVQIVGKSNCIIFNEVPSRCDECQPQAIPPVPCNAAYDDYIDVLTSMTMGSDDSGTFPAPTPTITETEFCDKQFAAITDAYLYYLDALNITDQNSLLFISISQFGATPLGYDNQVLLDVVDDYVLYVNGVSSPNYPTLWNNYVTFDYMESNGLCPGITPPIEMPEIDIDIPCKQWTTNTNNVNAQNQYEIYIQQLTESFRKAYVEGAVESLVETFTEEHFDKEYHYTLYYYDRAGNLVQTVPPKGVERFDGANVSLNNTINAKRTNDPASLPDPNLAPSHTFETVYKYNSLNQLVYQVTPDGGESRFAYDALGRLVVSQNAKQAAVDQFSYTRYDALGRVVEVGELTAPNSTFSINEIGRLEQNGLEFNVNASNFPNNWSTNREEVTHTLYDDFNYVDAGGSSQYLQIQVTNFLTAPAAARFTNYSGNNSRNRITAVLYQETYSSDIDTYNNATLYDYDVHGNVKELIQLNSDPNLLPLDQAEKRVEYTYDLVSGNVNEVIYQRGESDEFRHEYIYDADNRITNVFTSKDGVIYEQDAKYFYYEHGPLARTEIGDKKVQAMDYAYTMQGWIKSVNGEEIDEETMMGHDGNSSASAPSNINKYGARDAFGYSLSYFGDDYKSSNTAFLNHSNVTTPNLTAGLYNGNIRGMYTALSDVDENAIGTHQTNYTYDQLNRIKSMRGFNAVVGQGIISSGYSSDYTFDENGNLETLQRTVHDGAGSAELMDDFTYDYIAGTNQLALVHDDQTLSSVVTEDIDDQVTELANLGFVTYDIQNQSTHNYQYDEIGQLLVDKTEEIESIEWKVNNKVKAIRRYSWSDKSDLEFEYDAMGNRISKKMIPKNPDGTINADGIVTTYYFLDAQGNQMAIYKHKIEDYLGSPEKIVELSERNIYGSSRIGQEQVGEIIASTDVNLININLETQNIIGDKYFEMSNHLGNVLEVVSDRKLPVPDGTGDNVDYYLADVVSYSDYYPFGMQMPGRNGSTSEYSYGFQGQEKDDEVKGSGNSINYKFRMHDPRIGRFFAVDPLARQYPHNSPYAFSENRVIDAIELEGLEKSLAIFGDASNKGTGMVVITESKDIYKKAYDQAVENSYDIMFIQRTGTQVDENGVTPPYGLDYSDYNQYISEYSNEHSKEIKTLVFFSHGNEKGLPQKVYDSENNTRSKSYIDGGVIRSMMEKIDSGEDLTPEEQGAKAFVDGLKNIEEGGNIVIGACNVGDNTGLGKAIYDAIGKNVNVYLNKDNTSIVPSELVDNGMTLNLKDGWTVTNSKGTQELNSTIKFNSEGVQKADPIENGVQVTNPDGE